jgi:amino acid transporter
VAATSLLKRAVVGRKVATRGLEHTLLPKALALPVFSSDPLSSVAYATEEILRVLLAVSVGAVWLVTPISLAIATLLVIVVVSYRQTVHAYPNGGGAYIVSKDNLGIPAGLVAAAALLIDYVLTVSVSIVAGVFAITSAIPSWAGHKVALSIAFIVFITLANLRGVKEAGTLFAIPTYGFIASIAVLLLVGFGRCLLSGCAAAVLPDETISVGHAAGVSLLVALHAFSSGSTALTGVEAISNGVPAFRRPQAKNAATTLAVMATISVVMFLGISFLARAAHAIPSESKTVLAQIADGVFGGGALFYVIQVFTAAILILAANTAYQGFPRLASILARDAFLPRQLENRGDRLVFSNGIVVLAVLASVLVWAFDADLSRLIQLYIIGVFTSFTLSQTGMVRHWLKVRAQSGHASSGWRRSIAINGVGALATFVVLGVVIQTKFAHGAWIVIAAMPLIVGGFYGVHRHYKSVRAQLRTGEMVAGKPTRSSVVLYVETLDAATSRAVGYLRAFAGRDFRAIHVPSTSSSPDIADRWKGFSRTDVPLELLSTNTSPSQAVVDYLRSIPRQKSDFVTVVIPEMLTGRSLLAAIRRGTTFRLKVRLLSESQVVVTDVPVVAESQVGLEEAPPLIPTETVAIVFVSAVNDATVRAVNYALSIQATEARAVFLALDPSEVEEIQDGWSRRRIPMQLDIVDAPFRDLTCSQRFGASRGTPNRSPPSSCPSSWYGSGGITSFTTSEHCSSSACCCSSWVSCCRAFPINFDSRVPSSRAKGGDISELAVVSVEHCANHRSLPELHFELTLPVTSQREQGPYEVRNVAPKARDGLSAQPFKRLDRAVRAQNGYSSLRQLRGSSGCGFGVRSSSMLK